MEPVIFLTISAFLTTPYMGTARKNWMRRLKENGNKLSRMKESQSWFTIRLDDKSYPVYRVVQSDESVIFIIEMEERKIKLFRGENDTWLGDAEQDLIDRIGRAIEVA
jgi:hypothetical protein